ncbi:MAG: hypothetical protein F4Y86_03900 [Gammaproteobacteria bacterium]|nr:hypothetical protein [Gammaproteobacteria bacterium]MYB37551.1 hypothetical protein [Gammaproteobacteria bacterium]
MRLCSYKMVVDTGFAPNPFGCTLTLATCKPGIRRAAREGDWVAGFTSRGLAGHEVGSERLVYLMRVSEKLLLRDYFRDPRFGDKIPDMGKRGPEAKAGDNIYRPRRAGAVAAADFEQLANPNHVARDRERDVAGQFVLVSDEFYYFGESAPAVPLDVRPNVPRRQAAYGQRSCSALAERFLRYMRANYPTGRQGQPHKWPRAGGANPSRCA